MPTTVLYDGVNLGLAQGTGIATYGRETARIAQKHGLRTQVLRSIPGPVSRNPRLNEIAIYDASPRGVPAALDYLSQIGRVVSQALKGVRPTLVPQSGEIVAQSQGGSSAFDDVFVATDIYNTSSITFSIKNSLVSLDFGSPPDLFHATHPVALRSPRSANICTIHDLIPLKLPYATLDDKRFFYNVVKEVTKTYDHVLTVSDHTRRDVIANFGIEESRITTTYQAVSVPEKIRMRTASEVAEVIQSSFDLEPGSYYLFVGAIEPKKNIARLVDAFAASGTCRKLVLAGRLGWQYDVDVEKIRDERFMSYRKEGSRIHIDRQVRQLPYLPFGQLMALIQGARGLIFPSLYEGFGLPALEAMQLGTPVITSSVASLPEVVGEAAILVDPYDIDDIAGAIRKLDQDNDLAAELAKRGVSQALKFSPDAYRERLIRVYDKVLGSLPAAQFEGPPSEASLDVLRS